MPRAFRVASRVGVAQEVVGTRALSAVVPGHAVGVLAASVLIANGRATEVRALLARRAVEISFALVAAALQRIADEVALALANGPLVMIELAIGVGAASFANFVLGEATAAAERISGRSRRASANGHVVANLAIGAISATGTARVNALVVLTSLMVGAFRVGDALAGVALLVGIADVTGEAVANGAHSAGASAASINFIAAFGVATARVGHGAWIGPAATARVGVADVAANTTANGTIAAHATLGVGAARIRSARIESEN